MRIELTCTICGKNDFDFPAGSNDEATVICNVCGHVVGSMGELKAAVADAVISKKRVAETPERGER